MAKAQSYANDVLDQELNGGASGTFTVGSTVYTLPLRARFQSTLSTATVQGTEFPATGGYTAGGPSLAGLFATAASGASKASTGAVTVSNAPAGTWAGNEITDSTAGTPKRMNFGPGTTLAKTVNAGDTVTIPSGSLTGNET